MQHCNIAHSPQRCPVLVGPDLRAGRFMACTVTLLGRLGDPPLPHPCTYALAKHTRNGISQQALVGRLVAKKFPLRVIYP